MAIIHQHDKRSGKTYVYESYSYWDKEKKTSRAKRKLIGRLDPATGEIVATNGRCRKDKPKKEEDPNPDYKKLYESLQMRYSAQESLVTALQKELDELKERNLA